MPSLPYDLVIYELFPRLDRKQNDLCPSLPICGSIGLAWTHDRRDANARTGSVEGSVEQNCDIIRDWGAAAVLSLTEFGHERVTLPLEPFARGIRERHMQFYHLSIHDRYVPGPDFEEGWKTVGLQLHGGIGADDVAQQPRSHFMVRNRKCMLVEQIADCAFDWRSVLRLAHRTFLQIQSHAPRQTSHTRFIAFESGHCRSVPLRDHSCVAPPQRPTYGLRPNQSGSAAQPIIRARGA